MRIANVDTTVLITGESGTGKGVLANLIHEHSSRASHNFIKIDCTAIPDSLFESELFGYEPGSFTGAKKEGKSGLIELANHGTLFIDEIGELPLRLQTKLLTVIQDKAFYRIGGNAPIPLDIRIITATNRNLEEMVAAHEFREDLYYRLSVVPIMIPPLRERADDIYPLIIHFLTLFNQKYQLSKKFAPKVLDYFTNYPWKGNVRQLENTIERLVVTTEANTIKPEDLPLAITQQAIYDIAGFESCQTYARAFADFEKHLLTNVMRNSSSTKEMSEILQIAPNTITTKLKKYGIKIPFKKGPKHHSH
ncbi:MAG: sigma 54-interacting transcriptional regulator [Firmicutes bacterium]|nr:sigma 54-interacting transcriptional regulator [Bacillota bacterium]NBI64282.1 AAA family ATPase [Clostridiales bacterium]